MAEEKKQPSPHDEEKCTHPLMCEDEWKDPEGAKVLAEYHKDDVSDEERMIDEDLDAFERYWQRKHGINFQGEYHKEGAPYVEEPSGWDGHRPRTGFGNESTPRPDDVHRGPPSSVRINEVKGAQSAIPIGKSEQKPAPPERPMTSDPAKAFVPTKEGVEKGEPLKLTEVIDINTLEVISYWIFRFAIGKELHIPIKKEGLADLDIHIRNKEVMVNTNQLYFAFPELVVWHITYTHKGRPILEIGRGVKKGMKIHRFNAVRLLLEVWMGSRKAEKEKKGNRDEGTSKQMTAKRTKNEMDLQDKGDIT